MPKLTKRLVDGLEITGQRYEVRDAEIPGFFVRVGKNGKKSYGLQYFDRSTRKKVRAHIGVHGQITCDQAREILRGQGGWLETIARGGDPRAAARPVAAEPLPRPTVADLWERFEREHVEPRLKGRNKLNAQGYWNNHIIPALGADTAVADVCLADVQKLVNDRADTPTNANRIHESLRKAFYLAETWPLVKGGKETWIPKGSNPAVGVARFKLPKRIRYFTPEQGRNFGRALEVFIDRGRRWRVFAYWCLLLIYTGARPGEVRARPWTHFDEYRRLLRPPDTKANEEQEILLPAPAFDLLIAMREEFATAYPGHPFIIPGHVKNRPLQDGRNLWDELLRLAKLRPCEAAQDFHMHDLRHVFATVTLDATGTLPMVQGLLRHSSAATTERYAHLLRDPQRRASELAASAIKGMMTGKVVALDAERKKREGEAG